MKSTFLLCLYLVMFGPLLAQTPGGLHYQGVARNAQGAPFAGVTIAVRLSIKDAASNGNILYSETKSVTTNAFGLYSIAINDGSGIKNGDFNAIDWSLPRFLQTEIDPANGAAFVDMGTQQMQSVPHSLSAKNLDGVVNPQNGDLLEYKDGLWVSKPKTKRYNVGGWGFGVLSNPNFVSPTLTITIERDNPTISLVMSKAFGSILGTGGLALSINLGYQKAGGTIQVFDSNDEVTGLRVSPGNRNLFTLAGTYQTDFKAGETYTVGLLASSTNPSSWNDNGRGGGYVEVNY
ncbi:hypothetical protein [Dyadobacter sp. BHUBP1]|uniref:hypothetical protein n=1 Tax=Dyadobacter sp. BHUBP1 TaxID=3424178 RepID=UPI003D32BC4B